MYESCNLFICCLFEQVNFLFELIYHVHVENMCHRRAIFKLSRRTSGEDPFPNLNIPHEHSPSTLTLQSKGGVSGVVLKSERTSSSEIKLGFENEKIK